MSEAVEAKRCCSCKTFLPIALFGKRGQHKACRQCRNKYQKKWNDRNKERIAISQKRSRAKTRDKVYQTAKLYYARPDIKERKHIVRRRARLRYAFGMTLEDYDAMLVAQNGKCAICEDPPQGRLLAVDHNHASGKVRGLLCTRCNTGLGCLRDDPGMVRKAALYLEERV